MTRSKSIDIPNNPFRGSEAIVYSPVILPGGEYGYINTENSATNAGGDGDCKPGADGDGNQEPARVGGCEPSGSLVGKPPVGRENKPTVSHENEPAISRETETAISREAEPTASRDSALAEKRGGIPVVSSDGESVESLDGEPSPRLAPHLYRDPDSNYGNADWSDSDLIFDMELSDDDTLLNEPEKHMNRNNQPQQ